MPARYVRISPADVGERVSVRARLLAGPGEPGSTDNVGVLQAWADGQLSIRRRDGSVASVAEADLLAGKVLGPPPVRRGRPTAGGADPARG